MKSTPIEPLSFALIAACSKDWTRPSTTSDTQALIGACCVVGPLAPTVTAVLRNRLEFEINRRDEYRLFEGLPKRSTTFTAAGTARCTRRPPIFAKATISATTDALWLRCALGVATAWRVSSIRRCSTDARSSSMKHVSHVFETTYAFTPTSIGGRSGDEIPLIDKQNVQIRGVVAIHPPFVQLQIAYQRGTSHSAQYRQVEHSSQPRMVSSFSLLVRRRKAALVR